MIENYTLEPNTEAILPARLKAGVEQSGKVMMINRTATGFEKTGAIVCNTITVPEGGHVPLRLVNVTSETIKGLSWR